MRTLALKVIDQAYRDVEALTGLNRSRQFTPGSIISRKTLEIEKNRLIDWLLESEFTTGSYEYWANCAGMCIEKTDSVRHMLLDALDEVDVLEETSHGS